MRVVFAIPGDLRTPTGGYGYARRFLREAPKLGLEVEVLALGDGFPEPAPAVLEACRVALSRVPPDRPLLVDGLAYGTFGPAVLDSIRAPVVVLCHHPLALEAGLAPARVAELAGSERRALAFARHVLTTSRATALILSDQYGVAPARLTVAPPGTDPCPRGAGSGGPGCRILSVGSITRRKGHGRLISALAGLVAADWTLRIVGPEPDPALRDELGRAIDGAGLGERVTLAGPLALPALTAAYQTADLFVLASEYEGFGMAFAEAMAHGLPVLGLDTPAVAEATRGAARLVRPEHFSEALEELVRDAGARAALAERCWQAAAGLPRWPATAAIIARVLRSVA